MKKGFILILILLFVVKTYPQTNTYQKKPATKQQSLSEIDRLYNKYKNIDTITLYTSTYNLEGFVYISFNDNKKPYSISISGNSKSTISFDYDKKAISEFLSNTIKMKIKQGYKRVDGDEFINANSYYQEIYSSLNDYGYSSLGESSFDYNYPDYNVAFKKSNMYFVVTANCKKNNGILDYSWSIETTDTKRQAGKNAINFDF